MKIFSNFDTKLRQQIQTEYEQEYGIDNVLCFGRSRLYRMLKVVLPTICITVFSIFALRFGSSYFVYTLIAVLAFDALLFFPISGKYIDYKLDFIIVIPSCIIMYDQGGIFRRNVVTINSPSIKTISVKKDKVLYSIFDNGDIVVLTEWDAHLNGETTFHRVPKPEKRRNQLVKIVGIDIQANQDPK